MEFQNIFQDMFSTHTFKTPLLVSLNTCFENIIRMSSKMDTAKPGNRKLESENWEIGKTGNRKNGKSMQLENWNRKNGKSKSGKSKKRGLGKMGNPKNRNLKNQIRKTVQVILR